MEKIKKFFDIKTIQINKEYYEKLKKVDYTRVEDALYGWMIPYQDYILDDLSLKYDIEFGEGEVDEELTEELNELMIKNPEEYERIMKEIDESSEMIKSVLTINFFPYPDMELITVVGAYILLILQEPLSEKKIDSSILKNSNLPNEVQKIISPYISDSFFEMQLFSLINKFGKDELLAFIVFSFDFNHYLKYHEKKSSYTYKSCYSLPDSLLKLFLNILDIKDNDQVLNLYSDLGTFLITSFLYNPTITAYGSEDYFLSDKLSILKASLFSNNIKFENTSKENGVVFYDTDEENMTTLEYFENRGTQKVDKIFLNLSQIFGHYKNNIEEITISYRNKVKNNFKIENDILKDASLEWLLHILLINQLKDNGKAISLVKTNILFEPKNKNIRKYFIENGYIESIIYLPKNILIDYPFSLTLIVFSKANKNIKFIDTYNFFKMEKFKIEFVVNTYNSSKIEDIKEQDINIVIDNNIEKIIDLINNTENNKETFFKKVEYFSTNNYNLIVTKNVEILTEFLLEVLIKIKDKVKFKDFIKNVIRGSQIKTTELKNLKATEKTPYIYISLSDINDGLIEFENIENYLKEIPKNQEKFCVKNNSILLSKYGNSPKLAVAQIPDNIKVIPSGNFIIIEVDEKKIDPWYLAALFSGTFGSKILEEAYTDADNDTLSIRKLLEDIIIPVPPMRKQKKIGKEYYESINRIKEMKRKLKDEIQNSKEVFIKYNGGF
ncbi:N-6 DNA methylase [Fusobacterium polymorphum]|uniref:N-6 DNA methylase n=1 Tax=Fusobacterium nucleatum subsp. polymorphum TaxID=76857 RepID=UPI00300892B0